MIEGTKISFIILFAIMSCSRNPHDGADVKQLGMVDESCMAGYNQARAQQIAMMIQGFVRTSGRATAFDVAMELSLVPDAYIEYLVQRARSNRFYIEVIPSGSVIAGSPGIAGLTQLSGFGAMEPDWIQVMEDQLPHAMVHEVGHAVESFAIYNAPKMMAGASVDGVFQQAMYGSPDSQNMGSYPRTNASEYFAEVFSHYYCSPQTTMGMQQQFPVSYQFASSMLISPLWAGAGNSNQGFGANRYGNNGFGTSGFGTNGYMNNQIGNGAPNYTPPARGFNSPGVNGLSGYGAGGAFSALCMQAVQSLGVPANVCQSVGSLLGGFSLSDNSGKNMAHSSKDGVLLAPVNGQEYQWGTFGNAVVIAPGVTDPTEIDLEFNGKALGVKFQKDVSSPKCKECFTAGVLFPELDLAKNGKAVEAAQLAVVVNGKRSRYTPTTITMVQQIIDKNLPKPGKPFNRSPNLVP